MTTARRKWLRIGAGVYGLLLTVGSLLPSGPDAPGGWDRSITPRMQNALHAPAYAGLTVLAILCAPKPPAASRRPLWLALGCAGYGAMLEGLQGFIPGRTASAADALLNAAGVALGVLAVEAARRIGRPAAGGARPCRPAPPGQAGDP